MVEDRTAESTELLKALFPYSGKAVLLGLTGSPGAGKSTLVDQIAREYRKQGKTIGIVAVDPTSPFSGGAILGDRIRMQSHYADAGIYIRSMATRGSLGGLASTTADVATVLDASGRDLVMIETVGVGQDEVDIVTLADVTVVVLVPGMGDDVQTIKAGIMEIADVFVINKSDREGAERVEREIRAMQSLATRKDNWTPPIVKTVASDGTGVAETLLAIESYRAYLEQERSGAAAAYCELAQTHHGDAARRAVSASGNELSEQRRCRTICDRDCRAQARSVFAGRGDRRGDGEGRVTMLVVAVDTSGRNGSVALCRGDSGGSEVLQLSTLEGGTYSERLLPEIAELLVRAKVAKTQLDVLVVVDGPGSFTGLRVGLSTVKAFCEVLKKPLVVVSMLEALAVHYGNEGEIVTTVLDAGRGEMYLGEYEVGGHGARPARESIAKVDEFVAQTHCRNREL